MVHWEWDTVQYRQHFFGHWRLTTRHSEQPCALCKSFSSGVSGYSHHRFGNINKKLFRALVIPGIIGAIVGASLLFLPRDIHPGTQLPLSIYTLYLGYFILRKAFAKAKYHSKVKRSGWLASAGGFYDSFLPVVGGAHIGIKYH